MTGAPRPKSAATRARILARAREAFARSGFQATSVRSIAAAAGVDQALVHRYFGTKRELFLASVQVGSDPAQVMAPVLATPREGMGEAFVRAVLLLWESGAEEALVSTLRTLVGTDEGANIIQGFVLDVALRQFEDVVDDPPGSAQTRLSLVASQTAGLVLARKVARLEPLASMPVEDVVALVAPTVQRYMTGDLPEVWARASRGGGSARTSRPG